MNTPSRFSTTQLRGNNMPITKNKVDETAPAPVSRKLDSLPAAEKHAPPAEKTYKGRDFDAEARGKVACAAFNAALSSPGLAGLQYATLDDFLKLVTAAADAAVSYTWRHQDGK